MLPPKQHWETRGGDTPPACSATWLVRAKIPAPIIAPVGIATDLIRQPSTLLPP